MFVIFLTDRRETVEFKDYPGGDSIKFMMNFKKIFPSTMDLLLPILPESDEQVEDITWESTHKDYQMFDYYFLHYH